MKVDLHRTFTFEAAHRNLSAPPDAPSARLHGHSYRVVVQVGGTVDERLGWLVDFADIKAACYPIVAQLDHRLLNDIEGMTDTSCGDIGRWLTSRLKGVLPGYTRCDVHIIGCTSLAPVVENNPTSGRGSERVAFGFAAAHYLPHLPPEHKCRRMHGHSFNIELATSLPQVVISRIEAKYPNLDHCLLNEVKGLENPTSELLARWIWESVARAPGDVDSVTVKETCTSGCVYHGKD